MATPIHRGTQALVEQADSPRWVFGESIRMERNFKGTYAICLASAPGYGARAPGFGLSVLESNVTHERGGIGSLRIVYGKLPGDPPQENQPLPPDDEEMERNQMEYSILKAPFFAPLGNQTLADINTILHTSFDSEEYTNAARRLIFLDGDQRALAENLITKFRRGTTHWLIFPPEYTRRSYTWGAPTNLSAGGFIQTPTSIRLPIPSGLRWLRKADSCAWNGTHFVKVSRWQASPEIDEDLYPEGT